MMKRTLVLPLLASLVFSLTAQAGVCDLKALESAKAPREKVTILVEGAGDVVERFYQPALAKLKAKYGAEKDIQLIFTDMSMGEDAIRKEKRLRIKEKLESIGAQYIDNSTPEGQKAYAAATPDYVVVATPAWLHSKQAKTWTERKNPPKRVFMEKPVDSIEGPAQNLLETLAAADPRVMALDHYRPKSGLNPYMVARIEGWLGGKVEKFKYYLLEDRSSADPTNNVANTRDGAIEGEGRVAVLKEGVALDLLSHMLAIVDYFGPVATTRPVRVWAGRYTGVDGNPLKPTEIPAETFFATEFTFQDHHGNTIQGEAAVGKGIKGVRAYGKEFEHNAKLVEFVGANGKKVRLDLRRVGEGAGNMLFLDANGEVAYKRKLTTEPYELFFEGIITGNSGENGFSMHMEEGIAILRKLNEFRNPLSRQPLLPLYPGGMKGLRDAPYVEDLLKSLPRLSGPGAKTVTLAEQYSHVAADRDFLMIGGAGVMGKGFTKRLAEAGKLKVVVSDPSPSAQSVIDSLGQNLDIKLITDPYEAVASLQRPRKIMFLVPNEKILDGVLSRIEPVLEPGDVVVDGGNSLWSETEKRQARLAARGIDFIGMGVSGGERGARDGSSMMPGGSAAGYAKVRPIFESIAAQVPSLNPATNMTFPSVTYVGPGGAGHYVKMVHNGVEYAEMQMLAESYDILSEGMGYSAGQIREIFGQWNKGEVNSFLLGAAEKVLGRTDDRTGNPLVDQVLDKAKQKGTGKWSAESSLNLGVFAPTLDVAVQARFASALKDERVALQAVLKGPKLKTLSPKTQDKLLRELPKALLAAKMLDFAQGMHLIRVASREQFKGNVNIGAVTGIWRRGSILQGHLLDKINQIYVDNPAIENLLFDPSFQSELNASINSLRYVVNLMSGRGIPLPAFSSALTYYDSMRRGKLPANLLQALRDYFGGHRFERIDEQGEHHDTWGD